MCAQCGCGKHGLTYFTTTYYFLAVPRPLLRAPSWLARGTEMTTTRETPSCSRHDNAPNRTRVAVCVVGFARTFGHPAVHQSIANTFRDSPETAFDVFVVISLGDKEQDTAKGQRYPMGAASVNAARKVLRPTGWDQASLRAEGPRACKDPCMAQFERLEQCGALVAAEELRCGRTYSWVAKVRTDTVVHGSIASWARLNTSFLWKDRWAGDSLVLLPRDRFDAIVRDLGSGNIREYVPFNSFRSHASQPESCWGMLGLGLGLGFGLGSGSGLANPDPNPNQVCAARHRSAGVRMCSTSSAGKPGWRCATTRCTIVSNEPARPRRRTRSQRGSQRSLADCATPRGMTDTS